MASYQSRIFTSFLWLINKKSFLRRQLDTGRFKRFDYPIPPAALFSTIERQQLHDRNVFILKPKEQNRHKRHTLYLHGGAYVQGFNLAHWLFLSQLIKRSGTTVTAPDYPLAPAFTYREAFAMVEKLYKQMILSLEPSNIILMGDSAGGGFALALAQKLKNDNIPLPGQIILLSPWVDITLKNPAINDIEKVDPFLDKESLQQAGRMYAGDTNPDHYLLSPINGPLEGLGRITVFAGSNEILAADTRKLKFNASVPGTTMDYYEYPEMVHTWMFLNFPESKRTRQQINDLIRIPIPGQTKLS